MWFLLGSRLNLTPCRPANASTPLKLSTLIARASSIVAPTRVIRRLPVIATNAAPARV
jgi:hypothetical protein